MALSCSPVGCLLIASGFWFVVLWGLTSIYPRVWSKVERPSRATWIATLIGTLAIAALVLYRSPFSASNLEVSDSVEYVVAAERLERYGAYELWLDGKKYPPRYPPAFSLTFGYPALALLGPDLGAPIIGVYLFSLLGVVAAFMAGAFLGGTWGGFLAGIALVIGPEYRQMSRIIWTDGPLAVLALHLFLLWVVTEKEDRGVRFFAIAGLLCGVATLFRSTNIILAAPFLIIAAGSVYKVSAAAALLFPIVVSVASHFLYNQMVFGDPVRSGYHYWTAVPYDYPSMTFSIDYIQRNLKVLWIYGSLPELSFLLLALPLIARGNAAALQKLREMPCRVWFFLAVLCAVYLPVYLPYYYFRERFLLPLGVCVAVMVASLAGMLIGSGRNRILGAVVAAVFCVALYCRPFMIEVPERRLTAERLRVTPSDAVIVTALNPAYLEPLVVRGTQRTIIPVSRRVEFASKVVSERRIDLPRAWHPSHHRAPVVRRAGREVFPKVAVNSISELRKLVSTGRPVFIDFAFLNGREARIFRTAFHTRRVAKRLRRVVRAVHDRD